jgi:Spy/CpxP family protein refolding chaperone
LPARSNIWLGVLIGASCLLIGFAVSTMAYRYRYLRVPGGSIIERMNRELALTPAQRDRIGDIMREARFKATQARRDFQHQRHQVFLRALTDVRATLTPEQQQKFDRDFSRPWSHHGGRWHDREDEGLEGPPPQEAPQQAPAQH